MDREAWVLSIGSQRAGHDWATKHSTAQQSDQSKAILTYSEVSIYLNDILVFYTVVMIQGLKLYCMSVCVCVCILFLDHTWNNFLIWILAVTLHSDYLIYIYIYIFFYDQIGLLRWLSGKELTCQCRRGWRLRFNPWVRKIPWKRKWQPTPVLLPGEFHGQRSYSPWGHRVGHDLATKEQQWMSQ